MTTEKLTEQDIEEMESAVAKATAEPWLKGHNPTSREPMEYIAEAYSYGPPGLVYLVCAPVDGKPIDEEARFTAITGNGPTSEANAAFIARARSFVPRAIADLRRLRDENERLARENSVILDGQAALKSDLELATERAERAEATVRELRAAYGVSETQQEADRDQFMASVESATAEQIAAWIEQQAEAIGTGRDELTGSEAARELALYSTVEQIRAGAWRKEQP